MTLPKTMTAMVAAGHGDFEQMVLHTDGRRPVPAAYKVAIKLGACELTNTDVNTGLGWYSKTVTGATTGGAFEEIDDHNPIRGGGPISFPHVQEADVWRETAAVGMDVGPARIREPAITEGRLGNAEDLDDISKTGCFGSERDAGVPAYSTTPSRNVLAARSDVTDAEAVTFSSSYSTAEGMLTRARVMPMASEAKHNDVTASGPDRILRRAPSDVPAALCDAQIAVVAEIVCEANWPTSIDVLQRGSRYTCSGATAGQVAERDLCIFHLRDLTLTGSTLITPEVMPNLARCIDRGQIKLTLAATDLLDQPWETLDDSAAIFYKYAAPVSVDESLAIPHYATGSARDRTADIASGQGRHNDDSHLHLPEDPGLGRYPDDGVPGDQGADYA